MTRSQGIENAAKVALAVMLAAGAVVLLGPFQGLERILSLSDKSAHFLAFYGLTVVGLLAAPRLRRTDVAWVVLYLGWAIEVAQAVAGRDADFRDAVADTLGVAAAMAPLYTLEIRAQARGRVRRRRERRSGRLRPQPAREVAAR